MHWSTCKAPSSERGSLPLSSTSPVVLLTAARLIFLKHSSAHVTLAAQKPSMAPHCLLNKVQTLYSDVHGPYLPLPHAFPLLSFTLIFASQIGL